MADDLAKIEQMEVMIGGVPFSVPRKIETSTAMEYGVHVMKKPHVVIVTPREQMQGSLRAVQSAK